MAEILQGLGLSISSDDSKADEALELMRLAASLSSMTQVRTQETMSSEQDSQPFWARDQALTDVLAVHFSGQMHRSVDRLIPAKLTVGFIVTNYGYHIDWTDCLHRHLDVSHKRKIVSVFQQKLWLSLHAEVSDRCPVPQAVLREALNTLDLLFPFKDATTHSFLKDQGQLFNNLILLRRDRKCHLGDYPYWGNKIEELITILDRPPSGLRQFLPHPDRTNLLESANFWIAAFVALLAVISFVFGLIAVVYAKESLEVSKDSLKLTELQYQLSLAQACSNPDEAALLPSFCSSRSKV
ncbi:hypothetical protein Cob_v000050 [Colletotrichum orbiculare MAFF 240422]|uniref:Uncharacterized protein n=1 Tax=Colletotrichum orbiculare (strain 104-T / ATCC 96160 / CBS 514.97 / LARS 414 / MAFF 240422) TaxID=1213857 RepID=A0A484G9L2_COLOR|nr:hypothetical protein Cob_v000050 [Colletotrichum orbiculare MAFF 240422]